MLYSRATKMAGERSLDPFRAPIRSGNGDRKPMFGKFLALRGGKRGSIRIAPSKKIVLPLENYPMLGALGTSANCTEFTMHTGQALVRGEKDHRKKP